MGKDVTDDPKDMAKPMPMGNGKKKKMVTSRGGAMEKGREKKIPAIMIQLGRSGK